TAKSSRTNPASRGPRANEHLDAARDHERRASELAQWPDVRRSDGTGRLDDSATGLWYRAFDTKTEEQRLAASHRSAAAALHEEYSAACGSRSSEEVAQSPLVRFGI